MHIELLADNIELLADNHCLYKTWQGLSSHQSVFNTNTWVFEHLDFLI